jgi:hypothetical protein
VDCAGNVWEKRRKSRGRKKVLERIMIQVNI